MTLLDEALASLHRQVAERITDDAATPCTLSLERAQALLAALEQPQQEPAAWLDAAKFRKLSRTDGGVLTMLTRQQAFPDDVPLYATPHTVTLEELARRFAQAEREQCALACDALIGTRAMARHCADAIRARGQHDRPTAAAIRSQLTDESSAPPRQAGHVGD